MSGVTSRRVGRRWVIKQTLGGAVGFAVLAVTGCGNDEEPSAGDAEPESDASPSEPQSTPTEDLEELQWSRVDLGFVSAYVLVRGREAAVVDTGDGGDAEAIRQVLQDSDTDWDGVRHVILTHKHPDHVGSLSEVLEAAPAATAYIGAADADDVESPRLMQPVQDSDEVFGLQIVATPGHTAGHISVFDPGTRVLVAGDALTNQGSLGGSPPEFTENAKNAADSVAKLAALKPEAILVGHGEPVEDDAADALQKLAKSLS